MADYSGAYSGSYSPPKDAHEAHRRLDRLEERVKKLETWPVGTDKLQARLEELEAENAELKDKLAKARGLLDG